MCWWQLAYVCRKDPLVCCHLNVANNLANKDSHRKSLKKGRGSTVWEMKMFSVYFSSYTLGRKGVNFLHLSFGKIKLNITACFGVLDLVSWKGIYWSFSLLVELYRSLSMRHAYGNLCCPVYQNCCSCFNCITLLEFCQFS